MWLPLHWIQMLFLKLLDQLIAISLILFEFRNVHIIIYYILRTIYPLSIRYQSQIQSQSQSQSYFTTDGRSVSITWCRAKSWTCNQVLLPVWRFLSESWFFSDEKTGLQFAVLSLNCPSRAEPLTILYYLIWNSPNLEGQVPVFISPGNRVAQL
jgi:hypothetical protein